VAKHLVNIRTQAPPSVRFTVERRLNLTLAWILLLARQRVAVRRWPSLSSRRWIKTQHSGAHELYCNGE